MQFRVQQSFELHQNLSSWKKIKNERITYFDCRFSGRLLQMMMMIMSPKAITKAESKFSKKVQLGSARRWLQFLVSVVDDDRVS